MSAEVVVHGFDTSNNMKVRVALGYKGIEYQFHTIDPADRTEIERISGQHLTPVLVHRGHVLFDSAAILRYLDANFPGTPKLFGGGRDQQWEIEDWELFGRTTLAGPMMQVVHRRISGKPVDDALVAHCTNAFGDATAKLSRRLAECDWLVGDTMTAADITSATVMFRVREAGFFPLSPEAEALWPWVERVMAFDGKCRT